jgi:type I restriction enzyme, S subunit
VELSPGYKQTEVGVIPEDWDVSTVGREFSVQLGKMLDAERNRGVSKPYLGNKAVQWNWIDISDLPTVRLSRSDLEKFRLEKGDILVCEGGEVGRAAIWNAPIDECFYQKALHRLRPLAGFEAKLLVAILQQWSARGVLANYVTQTSIAHLPREKFIEIPIPRPLAAEQRAISVVLSDVDALLEGLTRLIDKQRDLKQATMQQLLTGRTRLPGFCVKWEVKRLGDHLSFLKNGAYARADLKPNGAVRYLHYGDIHVSADARLDPTAKVMPCLPDHRARRLDRLSDGDLVFVDASEDLDGVGKSVEIVRAAGVQLVAGLHTIAARFNKEVLADGFKAYLQFCPDFGKHLRRLAAGTKVYATNRGHIASVEMPLPTPAEQTAIATVLSDMNAELTALEARREKTRALKQAMLQELLTGRIRLLEREPAHA